MTATDLPSWREAREMAVSRGWSLLDTGDWSWVYRDPSADRVWRITPFDPAFDLFAEVCRLAGPNPHLPRVDDHVIHPGGGSTTIMELLEPVAPNDATEWLAQLDNRATAELRELIDMLSGEGIGLGIPLFAGIDRNPANVMARPSDGALVLTDAFWIEGRKLLQMIEDEPEAAVRLFPAERLRDWAHLPCMDQPTTRMILRQLSLVG